jgi:hypothetical protein
MSQVEKLLAIKGEAADFRRGIMSGIAAWSIDHPGEKVVNETVFPQHLRRLKETAFNERKKTIADICRALITLIEDEGKGLDATHLRLATGALERLESMAYCRSCARDAAAGLLRWRLT